MNLLRANQVPEEKLDQFLTCNENLNKENLLKKGYVVEIDHHIKGCFIIEHIEKDLYWLKQLYITQPEARFLPLLLESILALAKKQHAKKVFVHSHQPMVDIILESLQFHPQSKNIWLDEFINHKGQWWTYHVS